MKKKVLILGRSFENGSAGITMRTLFSNWDKESLFCASIGRESLGVYFNSFYRFGGNEFQSTFPFSLLYKVKTESKIIDATNLHLYMNKEDISPRSMRKNIYEKYLNPLLKFFKIYQSRHKYIVSAELKKWIEEIQPDVIYMVIGSLIDCKLLNDVLDFYPNVRSVVHFYDDWQIDAPKNSICPFLYRRKLNIELNRIFSRVNVSMAISEAMVVEYEKRYGRKFCFFHNPVDIGRFSIVEKLNLKKDVKTIVYLGRVDKDNFDVINDVIDVVDKLNSDGVKLKFDIYTNYNTQKSFLEMNLHKSSNLRVLPYVDHNKIAEVLINYSDILLLPNSFKEKSNIYTKYSISTKLMEYLASKKPVLVYAPNDIAITQFCEKHKCAVILDKKDKQSLFNLIKSLALDKEKYSDVILNGYFIAQQYDRKRICEQFDIYIKG
ncbi:MAG: glycosyltransferase [Paludibacteraceae bacterium]|nr:glycosyltransferase [Paludibacteraceae bacterium]